MPADCFFLDVAQGASQIICLGDRRAIVIDGGPSAEIPLVLLSRYVDTIEALIVSHNDADHQRGVGEILQQYRGSVKQLYFLEDRPLDEIGLYRLAKELLEDKSISECRRLERNKNYHTLYDDKNADLSLELLFPDFLDNLTSQDGGDSNSTSAVLALHCGTSRITFSGDATIAAWQTIHSRVGGPVRSDVFVVPHHGGVVWPTQQRGESALQYEKRVRGNLQWLFAIAFPSDFAVVSVGSSNQYDHPREWVIEELRRSDATVLCTQITLRCANDLERVRELGVRAIRQPSRSTKDHDQQNGRSRNVACAGTVTATIHPNQVIIERISEHQSGVDNLAKSTFGHPLCRRY